MQDVDLTSAFVPMPVVHNGGAHVEQALTIQSSPEELYSFWTDVRNLPKFMRHLHRVGVIDPKRSHWVWRVETGMGAMDLEWDSEIIADIPSKMISWQSLPGSDLANAGSVWFIADKFGHGTEVRLQIAYEPPAGRLGEIVSRWLGEDPTHLIHEDLRRLRCLIETGEIATTQGQPRGRGWLLH